MKIDFAVINAAQLVTVGEGKNGTRCGREQKEIDVIEDGALVASDGVIVAVGKSDDIKRRFDLATANLVDASQHVVTPGLVDCHTHPVFAGQRFAEYAELLGGASKDDVVRRGGGIWRSVMDTRAANEDVLFPIVNHYLDRMLHAGTTTVEAKSGYGLTIESELCHLALLRDIAEQTPLRVVPTFLGAHIVPRDCPDARSYASEIIENMLPQVAEQGIAHFCDVSCAPNTFSTELAGAILERSRQLGIPGRVHTDGAVSSGGWRFAIAHEAVTADHLTFTPNQEISEVGETKTIATLIPAAELYYRTSRRANARQFIETNVAVAIASDFCSSIHCASLYDCLALSAAWYRMSPEEIISSVTVNAAYAVGMGNKVGTLQKGKYADLVIFDIPDYRSLVFEFGNCNVKQVIIGGKIVSTAG